MRVLGKNTGKADQDKQENANNARPFPNVPGGWRAGILWRHGLFPKRGVPNLDTAHGTPTKAQKEQRKAGTLSGAAKAASFRYKSVAAQVGRFPRSRT
jgi:hypothetical protein